MGTVITQCTTKFGLDTASDRPGHFRLLGVVLGALLVLLLGPDVVRGQSTAQGLVVQLNFGNFVTAVDPSVGASPGTAFVGEFIGVDANHNALLASVSVIDSGKINRVNASSDGTTVWVM